jgi:uncharacterized protein (DUF433 family)
LPDERKPAIGSQACNALNPRRAVIYSRHFIARRGVVAPVHAAAARDVLALTFSGESGGTLGRFIRRLAMCTAKGPHDMVLAVTKEQPTVSRNPDVMGGTAVFHGTRVPVQTLLDYLEAGESIDDFLEGFPSVTRERVIAFLDVDRT